MEPTDNPDPVLRRLDRATQEAERLLSEAAARATRPPSSGWQAHDDARTDADPLVSIVESLRELMPPELQRRLAEALRELLLAVRALIDWYIERLDRRREAPAEVEDIPIS
jgi:hypothetical protein